MLKENSVHLRLQIVAWSSKMLVVRFIAILASQVISWQEGILEIIPMNDEGTKNYIAKPTDC